MLDHHTIQALFAATGWVQAMLYTTETFSVVRRQARMAGAFIKKDKTIPILHCQSSYWKAISALDVVTIIMIIGRDSPVPALLFDFITIAHLSKPSLRPWTWRRNYKRLVLPCCRFWNLTIRYVQNSSECFETSKNGFDYHITFAS